MWGDIMSALGDDWTPPPPPPQWYWTLMTNEGNWDAEFLYLSHYPSTWFDMCSFTMSAVRDFYKNLDWRVQFKSSVHGQILIDTVLNSTTVLQFERVQKGKQQDTRLHYGDEMLKVFESWHQHLLQFLTITAQIKKSQFGRCVFRCSHALW